MNCLDCTTVGRTNEAVGVCTTCGAAVCPECARVGNQTVRHTTGFLAADIAITETRIVACAPCATALASHHASRYAFSAPAGQVLEPQ